MPAPLPLFLNTVLLGGTTRDKLEAASAAGFQQIELWRQDVEGFNGSVDVLRDCLATYGLRLADYQVLLDFDGAPPAQRAAKRDEALAMLDTAARVGASTVLAPASTNPACDASRVVDDLRWLTAEAQHRNVRIAYEAMAWSTVHDTLPSAWAAVQEVGATNLGLVVDAFHIFARGRGVADLDGIPAEKIFLVQLSDLNQGSGSGEDRGQDSAKHGEHDGNDRSDGAGLNAADAKDIARHRRLLPGQGHFPLTALLRCLRERGYAGPIGLEVFNDALHAADPAQTARDAMAALQAVLRSA
ncbi:MAG: sugar phosphate isomerase/epimerase family protein [Janthinobacterium lividum]